MSKTYPQLHWVPFFLMFVRELPELAWSSFAPRTAVWDSAKLIPFDLYGFVCFTVFQPLLLRHRTSHARVHADRAAWVMIAVLVGAVRHVEIAMSTVWQQRTTTMLDISGGPKHG